MVDARRTGVHRGSHGSTGPVNVGTVAHPRNGDQLTISVEAVENPIATSTRPPLPGKIVAQWLSDSLRIARQWAVEEFHNCRNHSGRQSIHVTYR
jgi:hypothetical protein